MCVSRNSIPEVYHHHTVSRVSQLLEGPVGEIKVVDITVAPQLLCGHSIFLDLCAKQAMLVMTACRLDCRAAQSN